MKRKMSLGDLISALYDVLDAAGGSRVASEVVAACTLDLLNRQGKRSLIAALLSTPVAVLH